MIAYLLLNCFILSGLVVGMAMVCADGDTKLDFKKPVVWVNAASMYIIIALAPAGMLAWFCLEKFFEEKESD